MSIELCPFFNDRMAHMPDMAEIYKDRYCRNEYGDCARWKVARAIGRENVPKDLYPNQQERAAALLPA